MLKSIQWCRGVAAALVVLFHLGGTFAQDKYFGFKALDGPFAWGDSGVDFFFVLSGFLITLLHRDDFGRPQALVPYAFKRLVRIYPTYWVVCASVGIAALAVPSLRGALPADPLTLALALALVPQDPAIVGGTGAPILFVAWSLQYEMLFYVVFALMILSRAAGAAAIVGLLLAGTSCAVLSVGSSCGFPLSFIGSPMVLLFGLGVVAAFAFRSDWRLPAPLWLAAAASAAFVTLGLLEGAYGRELLPVDRRLWYGAAAAVIILALACAERQGDIALQWRWPSLVGDASYALYLLHIPLISVLVKVTLALHISNRSALIAAFCFIFLACVGVAIAFHLLVEKPMLRWLQARGSRLRSYPLAETAPHQQRQGSLR